MTTERSAALFEAACAVIPGGVNSPVRSFGAVGGTPRFIRDASGCWLHDEDGNTYVDFVLSWGPLPLGHAHPAVVEAVREAAGRGTSYGAPTAAEVELAHRILSGVPSAEQVRLVNSGTEATMSALRLARAATGRPLVVKFAGCYHGHADSLLVDAGSGALTLGTPSSPGVTAEAAATTIVCRYNDLQGVEDVLRRHPDRVAAVIVEPVAANMGLVPPAPGFLEGLRDITRRGGALLVFDEVITGFRLGPCGAQGLYGVLPDLTCLGKVIGGGLPIGAYAGPRELMSRVAPSGPVYQAGTLSGNPVAVAAGLATLSALDAPGAFARLDQLGARLAAGLRRALPGRAVVQLGSMVTAFCASRAPCDLDEVRQSDTRAYASWFHGMLDRGCYFPPSQFEVAFVSLAHDEAAIDRAVTAAAAAPT